MGKKDKDKPFDWSTAKTSHFLLRLAYVGTRYFGVAWHPVKDGETVESVLFEVLVRTKLIESREKCNFSRCGRTDRGVHAFGNYVAMMLRELPGGPAEYVRMLNRLLPTDIRILAAVPVPADFDARFRCTGRVYKYFFPVAGYDVDRMQRAAKALLGEHDFRNFCKADVEQTTNFRRTVHEVTFKRQGECVEVTIAGNAFLWHQIRCIMAILFMVGENAEEESVVADLLNIEKVPKKPIYNLASEDGLVLYSASYPDLEIGPEPAALAAFRATLADAQRRVAVMKCLAGLTDDESAPRVEAGGKHKKLLSRPCEPSIEERLRKAGRTSEDGSFSTNGTAGAAKDSDSAGVEADPVAEK
eukprot:TRINITY_DN90858_c0_g1_i1.p1 TRINITY_DN90858_c0_g1~~TRINITY_DN90858_c0_g1_i1.p1  ORF type:complete len:358 (+),score=60.63 TRINITY_DN90858_c0_g1_i1:96-1169(+)